MKTCSVILPLVMGLLGMELANGVEPKVAGADGVSEVEPKLPGSTRSLGEYLPNTVWDLKGGGIFRFRGDGSMVMPWHDFQWKSTSARTAEMFTSDWRFKIIFSEDMKTLEVPGRWEGAQVRRIGSPVDDKQVREILTAGIWTRTTPMGKLYFTFDKRGKLLVNEPGNVWDKWDVSHGLIVLRGKREGNNFIEEYVISSSKPPASLKMVGTDSGPKFEQTGK